MQLFSTGLYGFNRSGFSAMIHHIMRHPELFNDNENHMMNHEDYFTSHAFKQATHGTSPIISIESFVERIDKNFQLSESYLRNYSIDSRFYSIHPVKNAEDFYKLHNHFYDGKEKLKR